MKPNPRRLRQVIVPLPRYAEWAARPPVEFDPGESQVWGERTVAVELPEVVLEDYTRLAAQAGYTLGQLLGYLAVHGAAWLVREAEGAGNN